jgi:hypothetical protein
MPQSDQLFCKIAHDALSTSVCLRRHAFHQRGDLNNSQSLHRPAAFLLAATERWWPASSGPAQHHMNQSAIGRFVPRPRFLHGSPEPHCALPTLGGPAVFVIFAPCERPRAGRRDRMRLGSSGPLMAGFRYAWLKRHSQDCCGASKKSQGPARLTSSITVRPKFGMGPCSSAVGHAPSDRSDDVR